MIETTQAGTLQKSTCFTLDGSPDVYQVARVFDDRVYATIMCQHTPDAQCCLDVHKDTRVLPSPNEEHSSHESWLAWEAWRKKQDKIFKFVEIPGLSVVFIWLIAMWVWLVTLAGTQVLGILAVFSPLVIGMVLAMAGAQVAKDRKQLRWYRIAAAAIAFGGTPIAVLLFILLS